MIKAKSSLTVFIVIVLLILPISYGVCDTELVTYQIAQIDLTITMPDRWLFADRNIADDNQLCLGLGLTSKQFIEEYLADDDYMVVFEPASGIYCSLSVVDADCDDFSKMSDDEIKEEYSWTSLWGRNLVFQDVIKFNKKYYKIITNQDSINFYYDTVHDGKKYKFLFISNSYTDIDVLNSLFDNIILRVKYPAQKKNGKYLTVGASDPILSLFPDIAWGMTNKELVNKYGSKVTDLSADGKTSVISLPDIYDEQVIVMFMFEGASLDSIMTLYSSENSKKYIDNLVNAYGDPVRTWEIFVPSARKGDVIEDKNGDIYLWKTDNFLVYMTFGEGASVIYRTLEK